MVLLELHIEINKFLAYKFSYNEEWYGIRVKMGLWIGVITYSKMIRNKLLLWALADWLLEKWYLNYDLYVIIRSTYIWWYVLNSMVSS